MTKLFMTKAVVCVLLCICIGMSVIPNTQGAQEDQRMNLMSDENSAICGYVTYYETGDPFENVYVYFRWQDSKGETRGRIGPIPMTQGFINLTPQQWNFTSIFIMRIISKRIRTG